MLIGMFELRIGLTRTHCGVDMTRRTLEGGRLVYLTESCLQCGQKDESVYSGARLLRWKNLTKERASEPDRSSVQVTSGA
jgi:hypothetical protein